MGCCFSASRPDTYTATSRTPLLTDSTLSGQQYVTGRPAGRTPQTQTEDDRFPIFTPRPMKVQSVDKRIQDHMQLYNDHVQRYRKLCQGMVSLREMFHPESNKDKSIEGCFVHLEEITQGSLQVVRKYQYCMEIEVEDQTTMTQSAYPAVKLFNSVNKLIKEIMDKSQNLVNSVELVVQNEKDLRRDLLVASLGADGPGCMENCLENIADLKRVPLLIESMKIETLRDFDQLKDAAHCFEARIPPALMRQL